MKPAQDNNTFTGWKPCRSDSIRSENKYVPDRMVWFKDQSLLAYKSLTAQLVLTPQTLNIYIVNVDERMYL